MAIKTPLLTVDAVVFHVPTGMVLAIERKKEPFKGRYALPGGFVNVGETLENAVKRELFEETGLSLKRCDFVGLYDDPKRDPRGHTVSAAYVFIIEGQIPYVEGRDDAASAAFFRPIDLIGWKMAFDHTLIMQEGINKAQGILYD